MPDDPASLRELPNAQRDRDLHAALVAEQRGAPEDLLRHFHVPLWARLKQEFPRLRDDPELEGCVLEALCDYCLRPERYRPERGPLWTFLYVAARRDALNLQNRKYRQLELSLEEEIVAEVPGSRKQEVEEEALDLVAGLPDHVTYADARFRLLSALKPEDRPVVDLLYAEHAPFECYVQLLGLEGCPRAEQDLAVRRAKNRVHAARRRLKESLGYG